LPFVFQTCFALLQDRLQNFDFGWASPHVVQLRAQRVIDGLGVELAQFQEDLVSCLVLQSLFRLFEELQQLRDPEEPQPHWQLRNIPNHEVVDGCTHLVVVVLQQPQNERNDQARLVLLQAGGAEVPF